MSTNIAEKLCNIFAVGETASVEFKRCRDGVGASVYETICSFLNRFGGDIYLGVENDGTVSGIPANAASDIVKNIISTVSNQNVMSPTTYLSPEVLTYEGKCIIRIQVPPTSEVHSYKGVVYDRADDADVRVTATSAIAAMYIRKQKIYTERKVYPYVNDEDLRLDMLPRIRIMAKNHHFGDHPWELMSDRELLQSAGLISKDAESGKTGYNLAAIMLLGREDVILSVCPVYRTDAIVRKVNVDRYDDRLMVKANLIESYDLLMKFATVHLWDKFYLEGDVRVSLRNCIAREMLVNTLIHREFTSSYIARFIIEKNRTYTENANRAESGGMITPDNLHPNPKNPITASFFRNIGLADELGSGVRRLYYYTRRYSGKDPQIIEGDIFKIIVPLDEAYSYDIEMTEERCNENFGLNFGLNGDLTENDGLKFGLKFGLNESEIAVLEYFKSNPTATQKAAAKAIEKTSRTVEMAVAVLKEKGLLKRDGSKKVGKWVVVYNGYKKQKSKKK